MKHTLYRLAGLIALLHHHRGRRKRRYHHSYHHRYRREDLKWRIAAALLRRLLAR